MKFRALGLAAVAASALFLTACASAAASTTTASGGDNSNAPDGLVTAGVATACIDPEYAPLEYYENGSDGEITGFDADAVRALADHWGVEAKFEVTSFDGLMPGLQSSRCDFIFGGLYMSEERLQVADAAPIMNAGPAALAAPELAAKLSKPEDLCGLRVVTQAASSNSASVAALSEKCVADGEEAIEQAEYPKTAETVLAVLNGKADVLVETNVAAAYMATQNDGKLEVAGVFEPDTTFGVFTRKDDKLSPAVAEALEALYKDGSWAAIAEQYNLGADILDVY